MKLLGVDPGGTTGLALYDTETYEFEFPYDGQLGPKPHHHRLFDTVHLFEVDRIICERFDYRRNLTNANLIPVEYIGVLKAAAVSVRVTTGHEAEFILQKQLKGKRGLWTDEKLEAVGLLKPITKWGHRNDAVRQVLYYLTTQMNDMYWIEKYGEAT